MSDESVAPELAAFGLAAVLMGAVVAIVMLDLRDASPSKIQVAIAACPGVAKAVKSERTVISAGKLSELLSDCKREIRHAEQKLIDDATFGVQQRAAEVASAPR